MKVFCFGITLVDGEKQQPAIIETQMFFFIETWRTLFTYKHIYICETLIVKQVKVLHVMTYLFSSGSGGVHQP
jgi:hypothetical protein